MGRDHSKEANLALRFFCVSTVVLYSAFAVARQLIQGERSQVSVGEVLVPPAFWTSSCLLGLGSLALHRSLHNVRIKR